MLGYYNGLLLSVLMCIVLLIAYYFNQAPSELQTHTTAVTKTEYDFVSVDGPIQPIPRILKQNEQWVALGKALFNSKLLSKDNSISCASCHILISGGDDGLAISIGVDNQIGTRNAPTVFNSVFNFRQFWDGRSSDLKEQIEEPVHNPVEMGTHWEEVIDKLNKVPEFKNVFWELSNDGITQGNIKHAISQFEESLITPNSPIDRFLLGDSEALDEQQKRGLNKFVTFGCSSCHQGVNIGGNFFQKLGRIDHVPVNLLEDLGRYDITGKESDKHVFRVPSLRNVAQTAPYFHNGSVTTLEQAVKIMANGQLGMQLSKEDVEDLVAVLKSFTGIPEDEVNNETY